MMESGNKIVRRYHRCVALVRISASVPSTPSKTPPTRLEQRKFAGELNSAVGYIDHAIVKQKQKLKRMMMCPARSPPAALRIRVDHTLRTPSNESGWTKTYLLAQLRSRQYPQRPR